MSEHIIDHEVRIRLQEAISEKLDKRFDRLEAKMDSNFHWVLGSILTMTIATITLFGGVIFHMAKMV